GRAFLPDTSSPARRALPRARDGGLAPARTLRLPTERRALREPAGSAAARPASRRAAHEALERAHAPRGRARTDEAQQRRVGLHGTLVPRLVAREHGPPRAGDEGRVPASDRPDRRGDARARAGERHPLLPHEV